MKHPLQKYRDMLWASRNLPRPCRAVVDEFNEVKVHCGVEAAHTVREAGEDVPLCDTHYEYAMKEAKQ